MTIHHTELSSIQSDFRSEDTDVVLVWREYSFLYSCTTYILSMIISRCLLVSRPVALSKEWAVFQSGAVQTVIYIHKGSIPLSLFSSRILTSLRSPLHLFLFASPTHTFSLSLLSLSHCITASYSLSTPIPLPSFLDSLSSIFSPHLFSFMIFFPPIPLHSYLSFLQPSYACIPPSLSRICFFFVAYMFSKSYKREWMSLFALH